MTLRSTPNYNKSADSPESHKGESLTTVGTNDDEVPQELVKFLKFVGAELEDSRNDYSDEFVKQLQKSVEKIKFDREMRCKAEAAISILLGLLREIAPVSDNLNERIQSIEELNDIMQLTIVASKAQSLAAFESELKRRGY